MLRKLKENALFLQDLLLGDSWLSRAELVHTFFER